MALGRARRALVVGCGSFGVAAAEKLSAVGYAVTAADIDPATLSAFNAEFGGETAVANGEDVSALEECALGTTSLLLACTGRDSINYFIARVACEVYGVERVFARIEDTSLIELLDDTPIVPICPHALCLGELARHLRIA